MIVTLVNPPTLMRNGNAATITPPPPLGLAYIAGFIQPHFDVEVVDAIGEANSQITVIKNSNYFFQGLSIEQIISRINRNSKIIGITCMFSSNWLFHRILIKSIRESFSDAFIVLGGEHATAAYNKILVDFPSNVFCVLGEGEETFLELCQKIKENKFDELRDVMGLAFVDSNSQIISSRRERIKKLDDIPWPSWDLFPMQKYLDAGVGATVHNRRVMIMLTSRGCPYKCSFCSAPAMWGKYVFQRSPDDIVAEIRKYIKIYSIDHVEFMDLVGLVNKEWTLEFCRTMKAANLGITFTFSPGTRSEILSREVLEALKAAGLLRIQYAPDSGSTEEAKLLRKNANLDKMTSSIANSADLEIPICSNILIGYPGQKKKSLVNTIFFAIKLSWVGVDDVLVHNFVPYSGSEFHEQLENDTTQKFKDYISDEYMIMTTTPSLGMVKSYSINIPSLLLSVIRFGILFICLTLNYVLRPKRIWRTFINVKNKKPVTYFENLIYLKINLKNDETSSKHEMVIREFTGLR